MSSRRSNAGVKRLVLTRALGELIRVEFPDDRIQLQLTRLESRFAFLRFMGPDVLPLEFPLPRSGEVPFELGPRGHLLRCYLSPRQPRGVGRVRLCFEAPPSVRILRDELGDGPVDSSPAEPTMALACDSSRLAPSMDALAF